MATIEEKRIQAKRILAKKVLAKRVLGGIPSASNKGKIKSPVSDPIDQQQAIEQAQRQSFQELPFHKRLALGAGKAAYSAGPGMAQRMQERPTNEQDRIMAQRAFGMAGGRQPDFTQQTNREPQLKNMMDKYERISKGDFASGLGEFSNDLALLAVPGTKIAKGMKGLQMGSPLIKALITGGAEGAMSTGLHQAQNIGAGKDVSGLEAGIEMGASMALPGAGTLISKPLKKTATKIIQTAVKSTKKIKGANQLTKKQAERFLENYGSWRGLKGSEDKISKHHTVLGERFDNLINQTAQGKRVDFKTAIKDARNDLLAKTKTAEISLKDADGIKKSIDEFEEITANLMDGSGKVDFKIAQNFKKHTLDPMSKWDKPSPMGVFDPSLNAPAQGARDLRKNILAQMVKEEPSLAPLNKEFQKMAEIEPFAQNAAERLSRNRGLSMQDLATLSAGILGAGGGAALNSPGLMVASSIPFLLSRAQKSPGVASILYDLSKSTATPSMKKKVIMQILRSTGSQQFGGGE